MIIFHDISLRNTALIQVRFLNNYCIILNFAFKHHLESDISPKSFISRHHIWNFHYIMSVCTNERQDKTMLGLI